MAVMNPYNYSKPKNFIRQEPLKAMKDATDSKASPISDKMDQYLETRVNGAKPEELTYMLYEGLVKFVKKAILALEGQNNAQVNYNAQRAQAIIDGLRSTLDMAIDMSADLDALYEYMTQELLLANVDKDKEKFEAVLTLAEDFRDTWKEAFAIKA